MWKEKKTGPTITHTVRQVAGEVERSSFTCSSSSSCGTHRVSLSIGKLHHCPHSKTNILLKECVQVCGTGSKELNLGGILIDKTFILEQDWGFWMLWFCRKQFLPSYSIVINKVFMCKLTCQSNKFTCLYVCVFISCPSALCQIHRNHISSSERSSVPRCLSEWTHACLHVHALPGIL